MSAGWSELEIVRGLRVGDRQAWDALYEQYRHRVWRYIARLVGGDEDRIAEVFQETMLAAARSGRGISEQAVVWAWLSRISHNQAALYWRKRYRERTSTLVADSLPAGLDSDPVEALSRTEQTLSIRRLLAEMDAEHVALLTAKYIDELTVPQIVAALGGTNGSVRGKLERARQDFRQRLARAANGPPAPVSEDPTLKQGDS